MVDARIRRLALAAALALGVLVLAAATFLRTGDAMLLVGGVLVASVAGALVVLLPARSAARGP